MSNLLEGKFIGRVGTDPELKQIGDGTAISFRMAVKDRKKETLWLSIAAWGQKADFIRQYVTKGQTVFVEGPLTIKPYTDKEGNPGVYLDVNAKTVVPMDWGQANGESRQQDSSAGDKGWGGSTPSNSWGKNSSPDPVPF